MKVFHNLLFLCAIFTFQVGLVKSDNNTLNKDAASTLLKKSEDTDRELW
jgi:hypothetical protein